MLLEPLSGFPNTPELAVLPEDQGDRFSNPFIRIDHELAFAIEYIAWRQANEQIAAASFLFLPLKQAHLQHFELHDAQGPLDTQDELIVKQLEIIDALVVPDEGTEGLAHFQQMAPILVGAG